MKLFSSSCGYLVLAMASSVTLTLATERYGDRKSVRHRNLDEDYPAPPITNPSTNDTEEPWWHELTAKADKKYKAEKKDKADKKEKAEKATKLEKSTKLGKTTKKLHFDKLPKFAKDAKVDKESKLSKKDYFDTHAHDEDEESSPTLAPAEPYYPPINDDYFEEDSCPFDWIPVVNGTAECLQTFVNQTYIDLNVANALDCTESIEKALWHRYPVCFYLEYYEPLICNELFELADETWMCFENLYYSDDFPFYDDYYSDDYYYDDDYSYCYFDYMAENMPGCVYAFADAVGVDGESLLNCTVDFWEVYNKACYGNDDFYNSTCIAYEECQSIANSFDYCPDYYVSDGYNSNNSNSLVNLTEIVQAQMNVPDIWSDIYSGSISPADILEALDMYPELNNVSEWVWSKIQQCVLNYVGWLTDDFCYMQEELELTGGCVDAFADTIEGGLDVVAILTCELDYWTMYYDNCEYSRPYDEHQNVQCQILDTCRNTLTVLEDCFGSTTGYDLSDHMDEWQSDPELGGLLAAIYDGTVKQMDAFGALQNYTGDWSTTTGWSDFIVCLDRFYGYHDDYYHMDDYYSMDDYAHGMDDYAHGMDHPFHYNHMPYPAEEEEEEEESGGM